MTIFAKQGEYEPCGIFTKEHFLLILLSYSQYIKSGHRLVLNKREK